MIHPGPYHPHFAQKLPQFTESPPLDINEILELDYEKANKEDLTVIYESHPHDPDPALEGVKREYDEDMMIPKHLRPKTTTEPKYNQLAQRKRWKLIRKYRKLQRYARQED